MTQIGVFNTIDNLAESARELSEHLRLPFASSIVDHSFDYVLVLTANYLGLQKTREKKSSPFYIDFLAGKLAYRSQHASRRKEMLGRAIGQAPRENPVIIDATAGLGRDSFILAALGYSVIMLERSPIIHALLADALARAQTDPATAPIISRLRLIQADAIDWLKEEANRPLPDVIYLDPMFPDRKKSASVKKEMVMTQDLLGKDEDTEKLFEAASSCALKRVVVKRPRLGTTITECKPAFSITGKSSRFDIYLA